MTKEEGQNDVLKPAVCLKLEVLEDGRGVCYFVYASPHHDLVDELYVELSSVINKYKAKESLLDTRTDKNG